MAKLVRVLTVVGMEILFSKFLNSREISSSKDEFDFSLLKLFLLVKQ